jgi:hypothetical protein
MVVFICLHALAEQKRLRLAAVLAVYDQQLQLICQDGNNQRSLLALKFCDVLQTQMFQNQRFELIFGTLYQLRLLFQR